MINNSLILKSIINLFYQCVISLFDITKAHFEEKNACLLKGSSDDC